MPQSAPLTYPRSAAVEIGIALPPRFPWRGGLPNHEARYTDE